MAQDIRFDFDATPVSVTGWSSLNSSAIADAGTDTSGAIDLGQLAPLALTVYAAFSMGTGADDLIEIYALWSDDSTNFSDTGNAALIAVVQGAASTTVKKTFIVPTAARHLKFYIVNNSGGSIGSTGNAFDYTDVTLDQA